MGGPASEDSEEDAAEESPPPPPPPPLLIVCLYISLSEISSHPESKIPAGVRVSSSSRGVEVAGVGATPGS